MWLNWYNACLANMRSSVQTLELPIKEKREGRKKKNEKEQLIVWDKLIVTKTLHFSSQGYFFMFAIVVGVCSSDCGPSRKNWVVLI